MKLCQKICPNDILDKFKNGSSCLKNMATSGRGIFPYMDLWIFLKLCQYISLNDILDVFFTLTFEALTLYDSKYVSMLSVEFWNMKFYIFCRLNNL